MSVDPERCIPPSLPICEVLDEIQAVLAARDELVLEAPPGAGKTTAVPLALLGAPWLAGQKILMLEPRRMAARAAAERMASLLGEKPGQTIGYRIRQDSCVGPTTRVEVITEGILTRMLQTDPSLAGIGLLVFDEFHERNLDSDLGLALALQGRSLYRDEGLPLKLLVMSATLDGQRIATLLDNAPLVSSLGKAFPVELHYGAPWQAGASINEPVLSLVKQALAETTGSVLVFLPGQGEIQRLARALGGVLEKGVEVAPLYGGLGLAEQRRAIEPASSGKRKLVLATNIAETSLTIEGITTVVDSGLERQPKFDPATAMTRLHTRRISRGSSVQRMGRAGRLAPGQCYRLWSESQQAQLAEHSSPEILQADLLPLALQLLAWGVDSAVELSWLDPPPQAAFSQALEQLHALGAVEDSVAGGRILTPHGQRMASLPVHPRLGHMLIVAAEIGATALACDIAALLGERNPVMGQGVDIHRQLDILSGKSPCPEKLRGWRGRVRSQSKSYARLQQKTARQLPIESNIEPSLVAGVLLASAYPDRIARRRQAQGAVYQLASGRSAAVPDYDPIASCEWIVAAELGGREGFAEDRIYLAAELSPALFNTVLALLLESSDVAFWDDAVGRFVAEKRRQIGVLVVERCPLVPVPAAAKQQALLQLLRKRGLGILPWTDTLRQWQARVVLLHTVIAGDWPDVSDAALLASADQWLAPYLDKVEKLADFARLDLSTLLHGLLPWPMPRQLDELAPVSLPVPSGSRIAIDYGQSPPVLAVKLQEMFGCEQTPAIAAGKVPLMVHLLSPARRPLQVTQDLAGFWRSSYHEVKKDMKGRYPKHPWPDDPLQALPTRYTKRRPGSR